MEDNLRLALHFAEGASVREIESQWAETIAPCLLFDVILFIGETRWRITEAELYLTSPKHRDPFTHCDALQMRPHLWYFHKTGSGYKGGTYKGLDITIGLNSRFAGGILIRAITSLDGSSSVTGPSLVVDTIMRQFRATSVANLVDEKLRSELDAFDQSSPLHISFGQPLVQKRIGWLTPRVGLHMTKHDVPMEVQALYCFKNYRAVCDQDKNKKGKSLTAMAVHRQGRSEQEIGAACGSSMMTVGRWRTQYEAGYAKAEAYLTEKKGSRLTDLEVVSAIGASDRLCANERADDLTISLGQLVGDIGFRRDGRRRTEGAVPTLTAQQLKDLGAGKKIVATKVPSGGFGSGGSGTLGGVGFGGGAGWGGGQSGQSALTDHHSGAFARSASSVADPYSGAKNKKKVRPVSVKQAAKKAAKVKKAKDKFPKEDKRAAWKAHKAARAQQDQAPAVTLPGNGFGQQPTAEVEETIDLSKVSTAAMARVAAAYGLPRFFERDLLKIIMEEVE